MLENIISKLEKNPVFGIIGLGYVGLPLAANFCKKNFKVIGFDIDENRVNSLNKQKHYLKTHFSNEMLKEFIDKQLFHATCNFEEIKEVDVMILCVPTPIDKNHTPVLSYIESALSACLKYSKKFQTISLESTVYPGTCDEIVAPMIKKYGHEIGKDFFLIYSPEREDPNNVNFHTSNIPKIISGYTDNCLKIANAVYKRTIQTLVPVSSIKIAEASKILENSFRMINISFINEMKIVFDKMGIDVNQVINAAKTKPFGFQAYYPGPGIGGHCIAVDPFYLSYKAKEYSASTHFIDSAGYMNDKVKDFVVNKVFFALNKQGVAMSRSKILILGLAYKKNISDLRESPALDIVEKLTNNDAKLNYHDKFCPEFDCKYFDNIKFESNRSIDLTAEEISKYDLVLILTEHDNVDYDLVLNSAKAIIDTRGVYNGIKNDKILNA